MLKWIKSTVLFLFFVWASPHLKAEFAVEGEKVAPPADRRKKYTNQYECSKKTGQPSTASLLLVNEDYLLQGITKNQKGKPLEVFGVLTNKEKLMDIERKDQLIAEDPFIWDDNLIPFCSKVKIVEKGSDGLIPFPESPDETVVNVFDRGWGWGGRCRFTEQTEAQLKEVAKRIHTRKEAANQMKVELARQEEEKRKAFLPPPSPPAVPRPPTLAEKLAESAPPQPGIAAGLTPRPGDLIRPPSPDLTKMADKLPETEKPGIVAGRQPLPGHMVPPRLGENIGKKGISTFKAKLDSNGKIIDLTYQTENNPNFRLNLNSAEANKDPVFQALRPFAQKLDTYSKCCLYDGKPECDLPVNPTSQKALLKFPDPPASKDSGAFGANPFGTLGVPGSK
ncbi:MAG: hypothetical protein ACAH59_10455 [Pseudobdellovibrionaceae bacterium]